jgi:hypothetical protein
MCREGLSDYDVRRPLTRTGTNLLGLVKHLAIVEARYFGDTFGRPFVPHLPWWDDDAPEAADMWATAEEARDELVGIYRAAAAHADDTIRSLDLDAPGHVAWWPRPDVTLQAVLVHVLSETARTSGTPTSCASSSTDAPGCGLPTPTRSRTTSSGGATTAPGSRPRRAPAEGARPLARSLSGGWCRGRARRGAGGRPPAPSRCRLGRCRP